MNFNTILSARRSVRSFNSKKPNLKYILESIDSALLIPCAGSIYHLKYVLVEDLKKIKEISKLCDQPWIAQTKFLIIVTSDDSNLENMFGERGRIYSRQQSGAAIQNILLKLTEIGLNACWIGAFSDDFVRTLLDIPSHIQIEAIIPIGYEKPIPHKPKNRIRNIEPYIYWDSWNTSKRPAIFKEPPLLKKR